MILEDYDIFGCGEMDTGTLRNVLEYLNVVAPHSDEPFTEAMLFGLGGGIGAEYLTWKSKEYGTGFYFRLRYGALKRIDPKTWLIPRIASRIGAIAHIHETSSRAKGYKTLIESLNEGKPVITYLSVFRASKKGVIPVLPYYTLPYSWLESRCVLVYGINEENDQIQIADRCVQPISITLEELAAARAARPSLKHAMITIEPPREIKDFEKAIRVGIRDCYNALLGLVKPFSSMINCRVDAFELWAQRLIDEKHKQGWSNLYSGQELLFNALTQIHGIIEFYKSPGEALRLIYADFLEEAGEVIRKPELRNVSAQYRDLANKWTELANTALPDSLPLLIETRIASIKWNETFLAKGQSAPDRLELLEKKIRSIQRQVAESSPFSNKEIQDLMGDLSLRLLEIHKAEKKAAKALKSVVN